MTEIRIARAALSRIFEPGDHACRDLVNEYGPVDAVRVLNGEISIRSARERAALPERITQGWVPRIMDLNAETELFKAKELGGGFLTPEDAEWPEALDELATPPVGLWYRGDLSQGIPEPGRAVALTGSRDATAYGAAIAGEFAHALAQRGHTIISGLGYGIDAAAHRAALSGYLEGSLSTIAVVAGGLDRDYPAGNAELAAVIRDRGLILSEVPTGSAPTRHRFLMRNRIIAALAGVTVIVEARWRSAALNTAHHAETLGRRVAAVPGSIHSANSAGCHRLIREGNATCVTDATEVNELAAA